MYKYIEFAVMNNRIHIIPIPELLLNNAYVKTNKKIQILREQKIIKVCSIIKNNKYMISGF